MAYELSEAARRLLLELIEDELAKRETSIKRWPADLEAFQELSRLGLAEEATDPNNKWRPLREYLVGRPTDAGRYYVGQHLGRSSEQGG